jgi:hypothetical protein
MNTVHALAPFAAGGEVAVAVEVSPGTMMKGGLTGIGTRIAQGGMRTIMAPDEVAAADLTTLDSTVTGMAATLAHLKIIMPYPTSTNILSLLGLLR